VEARRKIKQILGDKIKGMKTLGEDKCVFQDTATSGA